ncbi:MAG: hypothetical protein GTO16_08615 [Candidatus Aminicenantes bacterium]|nr:hypothetical protein [Candidatus Aminicenantes bacterium]
MQNQSFKVKKFTAKVLLYTDDGINFVCVNQFYIQNLEEGCMVDGAPLQGKRFRLVKESSDEREEQ